MKGNSMAGDKDNQCEMCGSNDINIPQGYCEACWHKTDDQDGCDCEGCSVHDKDENPRQIT